MILSPIETDRLVAVTEAVAARLDPVSRQIFGRIADPAAAQRATGPDAGRHHAAALELATNFGLALLPGSPRLDFSWNGHALRSETEAYVLLHEIAHYQLASPARRRAIDFGLGPGPETGDREAAERAALVFGLARDREEALASLLGILWEVELGQPALASFLDQNWLEGATRHGTAAHFMHILAELTRLGLIDSEGRPSMRLAAAA